MFLPLLYELRARGVAVGASEAVGLAQALALGLHDSSLEGYYHTARSLMVHREADLDAFDQAFSAVYRGARAAGTTLHQNLLEWLRDAIDREALTGDERALLEALEGLTPEELERMFEERLREQRERHDGGSHWIGTGGLSPFGHSGKAARPGIRVGGPGGGRSAIRTADARLYRGYREDLTLDVRQLQLALRRLRTFLRTGGEEELDLDGTLRATAVNGGELEVVTRPPRRADTRLVLMMDVGGSMDPFASLCSRLFSAAAKSTHFKDLRTYYFHNCVYGHIYRTEQFTDPLRVDDLLRECGPHYKLILVGDAFMAPYELLSRYGSGTEGVTGLDWLMQLERHFRRTVWLNPEPVRHWHGTTIEAIGDVFEMFPLSVEGVGEATRFLMGGR